MLNYHSSCILSALTLSVPYPQANKIKKKKDQEDGLATRRAWWGSTGKGTFEKVDIKASLVNGPIRDELEPEAAGRCCDVVGLLVAAARPMACTLAVPVSTSR